MKIHLSLLICFIFPLMVVSQRRAIIHDQYIHFSLLHKKDTIDFIVADTSLAEKKPVLLFCQGSLPVPLFIRIDQKNVFAYCGGLSNFDLKSLNKKFHVVVISMPKTPLSVHKDQLDPSFSYVTAVSQRNSFSAAYLEADFLENYVLRASAVLKYLKKQKWVSPSDLLVAGHSQGARVALHVAAANKHVTALGLFGFNPMGRIDQMIRQARKDAESGKISWQTADSILADHYDFYSAIHNDSLRRMDPQLRTWYSFSKRSPELLASLKIPVYLAYGSHDIIADYCDLLPLYFIEKNKTNYVLKRYPQLDHNFFEVKENGKVNHDKAHWPEVMNSFVDWSVKN